MEFIKTFSRNHYGKLIVLGVGLVMLPSLFHGVYGVPVAPKLWIGLVWASGVLLSGYGFTWFVKRLNDA